MMHCDALIKLANDQKLWVDSSISAILTPCSTDLLFQRALVR